MSRRLISQISLLAIVFFLSVAVQSYAGFWPQSTQQSVQDILSQQQQQNSIFKEPAKAPPYGGAAAPLTTNSSAQIKNGGLILGYGNVATGLLVLHGNVGVGTSNPTNKIDIKTTSVVNGISFNGRPAVTGYQGNGWLRLDQSKSFPNGVYTPDVLRADGGMRSSKYCDINGNNCKTSSSLGGGGGSVWKSCYSTSKYAYNIFGYLRCRRNYVSVGASFGSTGGWPPYATAITCCSLK